MSTPSILLASLVAAAAPSDRVPLAGGGSLQWDAPAQACPEPATVGALIDQHLAPRGEAAAGVQVAARARAAKGGRWRIELRIHVRGSLRRQAHLRAVPEPPPYDPPDDHVALRQAAELLDAFLATLPLAQREAFVAMELEGLTAAAVAEIAGVPTRTIYSRVRVAREAFDRFAGAIERGEEVAS